MKFWSRCNSAKAESKVLLNQESDGECFLHVMEFHDWANAALTELRKGYSGHTVETHPSLQQIMDDSLMKTKLSRSVGQGS